VPPNGPELTGADPPAPKYSSREAATSGAASGAAWSWATLLTIDRPADVATGDEPGTRTLGELGSLPRKLSRTMTRANMPRAMHELADLHPRQMDERQRSSESEHALKLAGASATVTPNVPS
jgi:hypothetical protein